MGQDITVSVVAEGTESIRSVSVVLDGMSLKEENCVPGTSDVSEAFSGVGDAGPGREHELVVSAMDQELNSHSATTLWTDTN